MGTVEDTFVVPSSWLRAIRPRRGGAPAGFSLAPTWAADIATLLAKRPSLRTSLTHPAGLRDAGLDGDTPLGCGDATEFAEQAFVEVWVVGAAGTKWTRDRAHAFGERDPVTVSEIIRDLREVVQ
ncbi:hypothetical protein ACFPIJ_63705 [Dactylosporangium cerinum]|uniref:Uncharacterized protein n=1 Tax=Dactylosporangium cerinum TaxID=1434730 RepID=A0ABV9WIR6_9ACTN